MGEWISNGAQLAWLIDPDTKTVEVFSPNREPELPAGVDSVKGEGPVEGFTLDLLRVWDPLAHMPCSVRNDRRIEIEH